MEEQHQSNSYLRGELFEDYSHPQGAFVETNENNESYTYLNASTCPDCGGGMVKLGGCFSCHNCGYGSCSL